MPRGVKEGHALMFEKVEPHKCKEAMRVGRDELFPVLPAERSNTALLRRLGCGHANHIVLLDAAFQKNKRIPLDFSGSLRL